MKRTFMINSGLNPPNPAIPIPDFDVPNAAPTAIMTLRQPLALLRELGFEHEAHTTKNHLSSRENHRELTASANEL